jgi:hypothetical protein
MRSFLTGPWMHTASLQPSCALHFWTCRLASTPRQARHRWCALQLAALEPYLKAFVEKKPLTPDAALEVLADAVLVAEELQQGSRQAVRPI